MARPSGEERKWEAVPVPSDYTPVIEIARGGMGVVWLVLRQEGRFRRLFALKRPYPHLKDEPLFRDMFLDEARIAGLVHHPNVVATHDVGQDEFGPYLVMDYVEGVSATTLITSFARGGDLMPIQLALSMGIDAAKGLDAAHELRGHDDKDLDLVHRDVTPGNLIVGFDGVTRVSDFGIAKALDGVARTRTGVLKGKYGYMAPEQLQYLPADQRSDLFSLGVVLYELLVGRRLYQRPEGSDSIARRVLDEPPPDLADDRTDAPAGLVALIFKLLAKNPNARPQSAAIVARELELLRSKLVVDEGPIDVAELMRTRFAPNREREKARIAEAIAALDDDTTNIAVGPPAEAGSDAAKAFVEPTSVGGMEAALRPHAKTRTAFAFAALIVTVAVLAVALWWNRGVPVAPPTAEQPVAPAKEEPKVEPAPTPPEPQPTVVEPTPTANPRPAVRGKNKKQPAKAGDRWTW